MTKNVSCLPSLITNCWNFVAGSEEQFGYLKSFKCDYSTVKSCAQPSTSLGTKHADELRGTARWKWEVSIVCQYLTLPFTGKCAVLSTDVFFVQLSVLRWQATYVPWLSPIYGTPAFHFGSPLALPLLSTLVHRRVRSSWVRFRIAPREESMFHKSLTVTQNTWDFFNFRQPSTTIRINDIHRHSLGNTKASDGDRAVKPLSWGWDFPFSGMLSGTSL